MLAGTRVLLKGSDPTYFSEHALLPNLVDPEFNGWIHTGVHDIPAPYALFAHSAPFLPSTLPSLRERLGWLEEELQARGIETFRQNFTVHLPFAPVCPSAAPLFTSPSCSTQAVSGTNLYGIVRAPRGASTEAVVLLANDAPASLALLLSLAAFARGGPSEPGPLP